ncbi:YceK/YidQ family lipoprotein [Pseudomonas sp. 5P_3.1_Bac2]|uniref:YceK/YidQ family lipoprotein n=1 Tax=Pseudomonas sp. 5P_3.1_Bac2 TaxID=2971617 RepID=UPI0021C78FAC|nr:YceK/YidQ family lipoprotein [Pseudomonas sp. 5P_3.1_Bac2]MCU1718337.1 YceK/YidQ family lipoprotein [Pseudomonas sp. 5P_3.1_Bac2]
MKITSIYLLGSVIATLTGCGSIDTVFRPDAVASQALKDSHSHCESVPRVYSGVMYDFCSLNAQPRSDINKDADQDLSMPWPVLDLILSAAADTLVLPYTLYRQNQDGSIEIFR